jgi:CelD/BcsL family acetyltransferase involved in cellulose biosynthesis
MSASPAITATVSFTLAHTPWVVDRIDRLEDFIERCARLDPQAADPFRHGTWLRAWYAATLADNPKVEPLLLAARAGSDEAPSMLLPLVVRRSGLLAVAEPPDLGQGGSPGPIVRPGLELSEGDLRSLWRALRDELRGCDQLRLGRLATRPAAQANRWLQLADSQPSADVAHQLRLDPDGASPLSLRGDAGGQDVERCWRHFRSSAGARMVQAGAVEEGVRLLRQLSLLQHRLHARAGAVDPLARTPAPIGVHERFLRDNLPTGRAVMSALLVREEMVAGLFGIFDGRQFTVLRAAHAGDRWTSCAPDALLLERTLRALRLQGCRELSLGVGQAGLARALGAQAVPLREACLPLSLAGHLHALAARLARRLRPAPDLPVLAA